MARRLVLNQSMCLDRERALANDSANVWGVISTGKSANMLTDVNGNLKYKSSFDEWFKAGEKGSV